MTLQTMSTQTHNMSIKQPARHQRFAASPLARMRHSKGFTLVELMVVIVIVGILSAVALPKFLGLKAKAAINTQIGEASGLAKECATSLIVDGTYPDAADYPATTNTDLTISNPCTSSVAGAPITERPEANVIFTTTAEVKGNEGAKCGPQKLTALLPNCVITVFHETGNITYEAKKV
jgi:type IV pilus assembly protein PilA